MKAVLFNPEELKRVYVDNIELPIPGPEEALIQVHAVSLNHRDLFVMEGWNAPSHPLPLASDASGVIRQLGVNVTGWQTGDEVVFNPGKSCGHCEACVKGDTPNCLEWEVLGGPGPGVLTEYVVIPAKYLVRKPKYLSFEEAAALPLALGTAWRSMIEKAGLVKDEIVLIQGVGGGVSSLAMQIANKVGAKTIVTSGAQEKLDWARQNGAWHGINYKSENVTERIMEITQGRGVDLSIDSGGVATLPISMDSLRKGGRVVLIGFVTGGTGLDLKALINQLLKVDGTLMIGQMASQTQLERAIQFYAEHKLKPAISAGYTLDTASDAFVDLAAHKQFGKAIIRVNHSI